MSNEIFACRIKWKITQPCWVWYHLVLFSVKLFLFCHPQLAGYNDEVLDVKFLGPGDSHIVVATNSPQLKVFELSTSHCQILYGHTGVCVCVCVWSALMWVGERCQSISLSHFSHNSYVGTGVIGLCLEQHHDLFWWFGWVFVGILWGRYLSVHSWFCKCCFIFIQICQFSPSQ